MSKKLWTAGASLALILTLAGGASAGPIYSWNWAAGDGGNSNRGGTINWVESSFNTNNNVLSWYVNFGAVPNRPALRTDGFTLALNNGPNPKGHAGELALLYFDRTKNGGPILTAYGYNGRNDTSSHYDGSRDQSGNQAPDRIGTSLDNSANSWVHELKDQTEANGTHTLGFTIDVTEILGHSPAYPETGPWHGTGFDSKIGVWMHSFAGLSSRYNDEDYLSRWNRRKEGWLDVNNRDTRPTDPVAEPSTLALIGVGLVSGAIARRRRRSA